MEDENIVMFCYELDHKSSSLGFTISWLDELSKYYRKVYVISLRCGDNLKLNDNVKIHCINQNKKNRLQTVFSIWKKLYLIHAECLTISGYFVHMAHYFPIIIYPFSLKYRQKVIMWKAHKAVPFLLRVSDRLVDRVVSSTDLGYRVPGTQKLKVIGQGIDTTKFKIKDKFRNSIKKIAVVGRIAPVKNVYTIVREFSLMKNEGVILYVVGDDTDERNSDYIKKIKSSISAPMKDNIIFTGIISYDEMPDFYSGIDLVVNLGDTGSLDKTIVEPMSMGIPVVTSNESAKTAFKELDGCGVFFLDKKDHLREVLHNIVSSKVMIEHEKIHKEIYDNHSLHKLIRNIVSEFSFGS